jgi:uncharacterized protein YjbI with pentapeptide repeats
MDPVVQSALISAAATVFSVGATAAVAIVGFRISRSATEKTAAAARDTNQATIDAAHADVRRTLDATRDGQIADRYTKAIEQLGSSTIDVTIGGIYALERIAHDSPRDHPTVMEVLSACIREHSREQWPKPDRDGTTDERSTRPDMQAALTVIGRRDSQHDVRPLNLSGADLSGADLTGADLTRVRFSGARLSGARLSGANLTHADLTDADLTDADLTGAMLASAGFVRAKLASAHLNDADLTRAGLACADLTGAHLRGARLTDANLAKAKLTDAAFTGAVLTRTGFYQADVSHVDLTNAQWSGNMPPPNGWLQDPGSGLLRRASTDADNSGN